MPDPADADTLARRVAGFGLPGADDRPWSIPDDVWPSLLASLAAQRITGLAVAGAEAEWLLLSDPQAEELLSRHRDTMLWALTVERKLLALAAEFRAAGIGLVVLKGPAVAHRFYPDPSWRGFGDLDVLVRTRDWRAACALLEDLALHRALPEPRSGFDERFGKAAEYRGSDGCEVDLHRTHDVGPFGLWIDPDELFERTTEFRLGGVSLRRLEDTVAFLHACVHASLGWWPPLLTPVRDVAQIATRGEVDWAAAADLARGWRLAVVVRHALETVEELLGTEVPEAARGLLALRPGRREARLLEAYTTDRRRRGAVDLATLRAIRGPRAKAAFIRDLLVPGRVFLAARSAGRPPSYVRRWLVPLRWVLERPKNGQG